MNTNQNRVADSQAVDESDDLDNDCSSLLSQPANATAIIMDPRTIAPTPKLSRPERRHQQKQARKSMRGFGSVFRTRWRDKKSGNWRYSPRYTIKYYHNGEPIREGTNFTEESDAWKLLKRRHSEIAAGRAVGPDVERTTLQDIVTILINDYKANKRRSIDRVEDTVSHLRDFFGDARAREITSDRVTAYVAARLAEKAAASTINYELSTLGRMFTLAVRAGKAASKPFISKLQLNNVRQGFFEQKDFDLILTHIPEDLRPVLETAFITGWRVHAEILTRQKQHVDLKNGWLRLNAGETKNREGRMFPLTPRLREILATQLARTETMQKSTGRIIPWLFHRGGKQIKHFRRSWLTACINAGFGKRITDTDGRVIKVIAERIPHDFRRTAVRNLERAGVPRSAAMKMVGHKTQAIYSRYAIADEGMLKDAAIKLEQLHVSERESGNKDGQSSGKVND